MQKPLPKLLRLPLRHKAFIFSENLKGMRIAHPLFRICRHRLYLHYESSSFMKLESHLDLCLQCAVSVALLWTAKRVLQLGAACAVEPVLNT